MAVFDMKSDVSIIRNAAQTLAGTTANNTSLCDMLGYESLTVLLSTLTVTDAGAAAGFSMKLQHSDTTAASSMVDCTSDEVIGAALSVTSDASDNVDVGTQGYRGLKRYVRAVLTGTAATDAIVEVRFIRGHTSSVSRPVTAIGAVTAAT